MARSNLSRPPAEDSAAAQMRRPAVREAGASVSLGATLDGNWPGRRAKGSVRVRGKGGDGPPDRPSADRINLARRILDDFVGLAIGEER